MNPYPMPSYFLLPVRVLTSYIVRLFVPKTKTFAQGLQLGQVEKVRTRAILAHVEIIIDLGAFFKPQLGFVESTSTTKEKLRYKS